MTIQQTVLLTALVLGPLAQANPPTPHALIYGTVRDMYGTPLTSASARVTLVTPGGTVITTPLVPGYGPGVNYRLTVPMDSGDTPDLYQPNALMAAAPFKLYVVINNVTNLPIEMTVNYSTLGKPAQATRIDLTLGVDANGNGLPDQWERAFLATLGLNLPLASLDPSGVYTADGLTLRQQYLAGTYPFNPDQPCVATFLGFKGGYPDLSFPTVTGRYYSVLASSDARHWSAVSFYLPGESGSGGAHSFFYAASVGTAEVYVVPPGGGARLQFYRLQVQ